MTSKQKSQRLDASVAMMAPLVDQMPNAGAPARRVIARAIGERWAAEALARIERELDRGASVTAGKRKPRSRSASKAGALSNRAGAPSKRVK